MDYAVNLIRPGEWRSHHGGVALVNAIAAIILTTNALITDVPEKNNTTPMMPPGGGEF